MKYQTANLFVGNGEVDQINQILVIASNRYMIRQFCSDAWSDVSNDDMVQNLYLNTVKDGMKNAMHLSFDSALIELEHGLLNGGTEKYDRAVV